MKGWHREIYEERLLEDSQEGFPKKSQEGDNMLQADNPRANGPYAYSSHSRKEMGDSTDVDLV